MVNLRQSFQGIPYCSPRRRSIHRLRCSTEEWSLLFHLEDVVANVAIYIYMQSG